MLRIVNPSANTEGFFIGGNKSEAFFIAFILNIRPQLRSH
ncbi:MAG: hypothetical protein RLZZ546_2732 [Bacteroidota bacterium]